jgi:hypothetical protein
MSWDAETRKPRRRDLVKERESDIEARLQR